MSEASAVQRPMLKYANQIGWDYLPKKEALQRREGKSEEKLKERYLTDILRTQLIKLNPGVVTTNNIDTILQRLRNIDSTIEGNREALNWLQGKQTVFVEAERRDRNITLIDFNNPENNIFHVTDEWTQKGIAFSNRADIIFLINGIPIAIAETKGETKTDGLALGIDQIRRYHKQTPEILTFPQIFEVTELWNFWYGLTWNTNRKNLFEWKLTPPLQGEGNKITPPSLVGKGVGGLGSKSITEGDYEEKIKTFFDKERFLKVLRYYIVFLERDNGLTKVVLRQHQTRAVEKVIERIQDPNKKLGLVWHTQGSGKTLTIITVAALLSNISGDNTIIMVIDRNELENQLDKNLKAYGIKSYELAESKEDLQQLIKRDYRGLIVAMIHKFDKMDVVNRRSTITVLVDEAHRTTGGNLGTYLMAALPNATFIGFTGTPVSRVAKGKKGTFETFGETSDPQFTLDKYSTADSVRDGTTLKLNYQFAKSEFLVPKEILEKEFLQLKLEAGVSDIDELNGILDRAVNIKNFLKGDDRVDKVAQFVAQHFRQSIEPMGFKAFLVGVDREACVFYKKALDKYLPAEYSTVVYSRTTAEGLREFNLTEAEEKEVRKAFIKKSVVSAQITLPNAAVNFIESRPQDFTYDTKTKTLTITGYCSAEDAKNLEDYCASESDAVTKIRQLYEDYRKALPKILIVTEKLLTGFDAPILYCMYLDKPMRDHVLLQGIARVNRPYEDADGLIKPYGFVLDFIGIFGDNLKKALVFDSGEINDVIQNLDVIKNELHSLMANTVPQYLPLTRGWDDKAKERAAAHFADKKLREKFFEFARELQTIYEILSPDPDLGGEFMKNYKAIVRLYATIRAAYNTNPYIDLELVGKTKELVRRNVTIGDLEMPGTIYELNAEELEKLRQTDTTNNVKILNLSKAISQDVLDKSTRSPYLITIGNRAEKVRQAFENRQIEAHEALIQLDQIANECVQAQAERQKLDVDENTFAIYTVIKQAIANLNVEQAKAINAVYANFSDYWWDARQEIDLRTELYATLYPLTNSVEQTIEVTNNLLKLERVE